MNVFVKFVGQDFYKDSYLKRFKPDGEIETTEKIEEAINLNTHYYSFETIVHRCKFLQEFYNPLAFKVSFFDKSVVAKIGTLYIKEIVVHNGEYSLTFTSDVDKAFGNYTEEVQAFSLSTMRKLFPCIEVETIITPLTLEEINEKV